MSPFLPTARWRPNSPIPVTPYWLAERYVGIKEIQGHLNNPVIMAMLLLDAAWPEDDETAWCSAFVNWIAWHLRLPRSKSLRARSWLNVGIPIPLTDAEPGFDVVVFSRGSGVQPGPEVIEAPGHVGWFGGDAQEKIWTLGGNQGNTVSLAPYSRDRLLGIRRLRPAA